MPFLLLLLAVATYAQPQPSLQDQRDGKTYKTVKIGTQIWLAENLNYNAKGSKCYENKPKNCKKYGRLYNWEIALKVCPKGWHLPSDDEFEVLIDFVGGDKVAAKKLKAEDGNGTDKYGFSALPGGMGSVDGFYDIGEYGRWWSASEDDRYLAYYRLMSYDHEWIYWRNNGKALLLSVRCVKDK